MVLAPTLRRNLVIMEMVGNMQKDFRRKTLAEFGAPHFEKVAQVLVGNPPKDFVDGQHAFMLTEKRKKQQVEIDKAKKELEAKKAKEEQLKKAQRQKKEAEKKRKKAEAERKQKMEIA